MPDTSEIEIVGNERVIYLLPEPQKSSVKGVYYGVEDEMDRLVGCVGVLRRSWFETEIRHLYVEPEFRNRGIAKTLIKRAFKGSRAVRVVATVHAANDFSLRAFQANGFERIDDFVNPDTSNRILLLRKLKKRGQPGGEDETSGS